jgi:outer membrane biosynthesis protein TonB
MSDPDRGAYTPPHHDRLAFDPRSTQRRRPVPMTLLASGAVLVLMAGGAVLFYQSGVRGPNEPPRAVGTPLGKFKTAAVPDAKPADAALDIYVQDRPSAGAPGQPVFTPDPEQPQPRAAVALTQASEPEVPRAAPPAPVKAVPLKRLASANDENAAVEAQKPAPVKPKGAKLAAQDAAPAKPVAQKASLAAKPKPKADTASTAKTTKTAAAATTGAAAVQIGAFSSKSLADQEFGKVRATFAKYVSGKSKHIDTVQRGGATLYRAAYTGFSKAEAQAFCGALKAAGRACIIK